MIVSDYGKNRIQIFNDIGGWVLSIDGNDSGNHSFQYPYGLAIDSQGNIQWRRNRSGRPGHGLTNLGPELIKYSYDQYS